MKKSFLLVIVSIMIIVCGCTNNRKSESTGMDLKEKFSSDVQMTYNEQMYKGYMNYLKDGYCQVEITEPSDISGLFISVTDDGCNVSFKGLSYDIKPDLVPQASLASLFKKVLDSLPSSSAVSKTKTDTGELYSGTIENKKFELQKDKNGKYESISFPDENISIIFSNFTVE